MAIFARNVHIRTPCEFRDCAAFVSIISNRQPAFFVNCFEFHRLLPVAQTVHLYFVGCYQLHKPRTCVSSVVTSCTKRNTASIVIFHFLHLGYILCICVRRRNTLAQIRLHVDIFVIEHRQSGVYSIRVGGGEGVPLQYR